MTHELTTSSLLLAIGAVMTVHIVMYLVSSKVNPLYVLAGVVLLLAPFSAAPELAVGNALKWVRGYALIMLLLMGFLKYRVTPRGAASQAWLAFLLLYILAGVWSDFPPQALMYKAQVALVVLAGLCLAYSVRSREEVLNGIRFLGITMGLLGACMLVSVVLNPSGLLLYGRLRVMGVVATHIAADVSPLLLLCTYMAIHDPLRRWRRIGYACTGALSAVVVVTGSRAAAAAVVAGFLVQLLPVVGRSIRVVMLPVFVAAVGFVVLGQLGGGVGERLMSTTNTRLQIWSGAVEHIARSPMFGHGWVHESGIMATMNMHNIFLQVGVEMGLLGLALLVPCLVALAYFGLRSARVLRAFPTFYPLAMLPLSLVTAGLVHGLGENSGFSPSSFAMLTAFGIGLIDCLPILAIRRRCLEMRMIAYRRLRLPFSAGRAWDFEPDGRSVAGG